MQFAAATAAKGTNLYNIQNRKIYIIKYIMRKKTIFSIWLYFQIYKRQITIIKKKRKMWGYVY